MGTTYSVTQCGNQPFRRFTFKKNFDSQTTLSKSYSTNIFNVLSDALYLIYFLKRQLFTLYPPSVAPPVLFFSCVLPRTMFFSH